MTGHVILLNPKEKLVGVKTVDQRHSVIEIGDGVDLGDELRWNGDSPFGTHSVRNQTKSKDLDANFRIHGVSEADLKREMRFEQTIGS
jgi:hypothetical protein